MEEQFLLQVFVAAFAILFMLVIVGTQKVIEKNYKQTSNKLDVLKERADKIWDTNQFLVEKAVEQKRMHYRRSIVAAALKDSLEEEIGKLHDIRESIKSLKKQSRSSARSTSTAGSEVLSKSPPDSGILYRSALNSGILPRSPIDSEILPRSSLNSDIFSKSTYSSARSFFKSEILSKNASKSGTQPKSSFRAEIMSKSTMKSGNQLRSSFRAEVISKGALKTGNQPRSSFKAEIQPKSALKSRYQPSLEPDILPRGSYKSGTPPISPANSGRIRQKSVKTLFTNTARPDASLNLMENLDQKSVYSNALSSSNLEPLVSKPSMFSTEIEPKPKKKVRYFSAHHYRLHFNQSATAPSEMG